jgi:ketosteroid isomerase-like protein
MRTTWALALAMTSGIVHADAPKAPPPTRMSAAECDVWNRERSFSRTVEAHDAVEFASHLHAGTVFGAGGPAPIRGRAAVVEGWKEIIDGEKFALRWYPGYVSIGSDPDIAVSSGPSWTEDFDPATQQRFSISRYTSTWVRDADGQWRVLFDGTGAPPKAATPEDIRKLVAGLPAACPQKAS